MPGQRSAFYTVNVEKEDTFATENGAHSWLTVPAMGLPRDGFVREALADDTVRIDVGANKPIVGRKAGSTWGFDFYATGGPAAARAAAGDGVAATTQPEGVVLESIVGTEVLLTGDTVGGVPTATTYDLVTQTGLTQATTVIHGVGLTGGTEWRPVTISTGSVTSTYGFSATPSGSDVVYGTASYQLTNDVSSARSFQLQLLTDETTEKYIALGCMPGTITIAGTPGQLATVVVDGQCLTWTDAESDSLAAPTKPNKGPYLASHAFFIPTADLPTYAAAHNRAIRNISMTITRNLLLRPDPTHAEGANMFDTPGEPVFSMTTTHAPDEYDTNLSWRDAWGNGTSFQMIATFGSTAGQTLILFARDIHITEEPDNAEEGGIKTTTVNWGATTGATAPMVVAAIG